MIRELEKFNFKDHRASLESGSKRLLEMLCFTFSISALGGGAYYFANRAKIDAEDAIAARRSVIEPAAKEESKNHFDRILKPLFDTPSGFVIAEDPKATKDYYLEFVSKCIDEQYQSKSKSNPSFHIQQGQIVQYSSKVPLDMERVNACVQSLHMKAVDMKDGIVTSKEGQKLNAELLRLAGKFFMLMGGFGTAVNGIEYAKNRRRLRKMNAVSGQPRLNPFIFKSHNICLFA